MKRRARRMSAALQRQTRPRLPRAARWRRWARARLRAAARRGRRRARDGGGRLRRLAARACSRARHSRPRRGCAGGGGGARAQARPRPRPSSPRRRPRASSPRSSTRAPPAAASTVVGGGAAVGLLLLLVERSLEVLAPALGVCEHSEHVLAERGRAVGAVRAFATRRSIVARSSGSRPAAAARPRTRRAVLVTSCRNGLAVGWPRRSRCALSALSASSASARSRASASSPPAAKPGERARVAPLGLRRPLLPSSKSLSSASSSSASSVSSSSSRPRRTAAAARAGGGVCRRGCLPPSVGAPAPPPGAAGAPRLPPPPAPPTAASPRSAALTHACPSRCAAATRNCTRSFSEPEEVLGVGAVRLGPQLRPPVRVAVVEGLEHVRDETVPRTRARLEQARLRLAEVHAARDGLVVAVRRAPRVVVCLDRVAERLGALRRRQPRRRARQRRLGEAEARRARARRGRPSSARTAAGSPRP